ncbi:MAG: hypothetical protein MZV70_56730 [Desulfobacterales bacterium]|nr:hypothetical protein [Desulfobacterales bacterium]
MTGLPPEKRNIAQVFQFPVLYDTMSVAENLAFPLRNRACARRPDPPAGGRSGRYARSDIGLASQGGRAERRRQAEDLPGPRTGAQRRGRDSLRRTADRHRSPSEVAAAAQAEGDSRDASTPP